MTDQNSSKRTKQNGDKQSDAEFKTLVLRMLKELTEDLNNIKKDPVRNKGYTN